MRKISLTLLILMAVVLAACAPAATPAPAQPTPVPVDNQATVDASVAATLAAQPPPPTAAPTQALPTPGPTLDPNMPVAVVPTPAPGEPAAIASYNTIIYSGPGESYVVYAAFLGGAQAKVIGKSEDGLWWVISVPPASLGQGWVSGAAVAVTGADGVPVVPTPPLPPTTELVPPGPEDPQGTVTANAYVRTGPGTNYPAYGVAQAGATGWIIGKSEDSTYWVVRLNPDVVGAGYGWIDAAYVQATNVENVQTIAAPPASETVTPPPPPPSGAPAAMTIDYVNVRSGPGTSYPVLAVAPPGASSEVTGKSSDGGWWQVKIPTEISADGLGWVSADWVVTQNTDSVPVVEATAPPPTVPATPPPPTGTASCALQSQSPADATVFSPGASFVTTWVLQNTGTTPWNQGEYDVSFVGAVSNILMHQGSDVYDLTTTVEPGWTYNFSVPMIAPYTPGVYGEMWQIVLGSQTICPFYVYIEVK
jgi:uncharacterized protein YraI